MLYSLSYGRSVRGVYRLAASSARLYVAGRLASKAHIRYSLCMKTASTARTETAMPETKIAARRDIALVLGISVAAAALCITLNLSEALATWTRPLERFQVDELPPVLLALAIGLVWFSLRRYREARREIDLRRYAEQRLLLALAENRRLAQQYVDRQEQDRRTLAHDLHDELGQYLNAIKIDAVSLREPLPAAGDPNRERLAGMISNIDRVQSVVLGLIRQLRPVGLDELGLAAALEHCVHEWSRRLPQTRIDLHVNSDVDRLDEKLCLALYRLVQEALTNVARHSNARRVTIRIGRDPTPSTPAALLASVEDDGVGAELGAPGGGLGLIGMRERAESFGGSLVLASTPGAGFKLLARFPTGDS
jgi:two-component system sensor histidine kinase UhpB